MFNLYFIGSNSKGFSYATFSRSLHEREEQLEAIWFVLFGRCQNIIILWNMEDWKSISFTL